jgi:1A family penicillin-binding protein
MESLLVKVFATALALSQVATAPDTVKTQFDPVADQAEVVRLLGSGCNHVRKAFDIENIDLDDLIETVMTDKQAVAGEIAAFKGIKFTDLHDAYRQFCKNERVTNSAVDIGKVIEFFNKAATDLPDHMRLRGLKLPGLSNVLDAHGAKYAEVYEHEHRRHWVPLSEIPLSVQQAFVAAEDKRFYEHHGVDERSVIRAFMNMMAEPGKRQGGSTITQQVAKNLLVGDDVSYERKIREVIIAGRVEKSITKAEILEIYLNSIYLGRLSWGVELAARSYFGKRAKDLTLTEAAFLAGLTKGPAYYNPDKYRDRAQGRLAYVLARMKEDGAITEEQMREAEAVRLAPVPYVRPRRDSGFAFVDQIWREARTVAGIPSLTQSSYVVHSTIRPELQRAAETALQDGLARYEQGANRVDFRGAETNIGEQVRKLQADPNTDKSKPAWLTALEQVRMPLYDVHWAPAVVVERTRTGGGQRSGSQGGEAIRVGLRDGRILPLSTAGSRGRSRLNAYDVVYVNVVEGSGKQSPRAELRTRPVVQGATVVLENRTGRVLAMVGGFSYPISQLNRATQSRRQPGSSLKPLTYLAALSSGLQPNTLISDSPVTFPPIGGVRRNTRPEDWWSPRNYDGGYSGTMTLRRALEQSRNLPTAKLLHGIGDTPQQSLDAICRLAVEARIYSQCERFYPFILGAQPVRPIDLAAFYAAVANEGGLPTPHVIDSIEEDGRVVYKSRPTQRFFASADRAAVFQLRSILQGVVQRGTARSRAALAPYIAGKTGTSDEWNDAWFVGFSNDVTIAVWVGYDNARGKRTLGAGNAGSRVALPIFEQIMHAVWNQYAPQTALSGPSPEAARKLVALPIDVHSGERIETRSRNAFMEQFRLDETGKFTETQHSLVARGYDGYGDEDHPRPGDFFSGWFGRASEGGRRDYDGTPFFSRGPDSRPYEPYADPFEERRRAAPRRGEPEPRRGEPEPRRGGPGFFWGGRSGF